MNREDVNLSTASQKLIELIGQYGVQCSETKELAPSRELADALNALCRCDTSSKEASAEEKWKLEVATEHIRSMPHGDNCFVSDHYEGDPGNRCNCGKDLVLDWLDSDYAQNEEASEAAQDEHARLEAYEEEQRLTTFRQEGDRYAQTAPEAAPMSDEEIISLYMACDTPKQYVTMYHRGIIDFARRLLSGSAKTESRNEVLEEAAKECEHMARVLDLHGAQRCANSIRALKDKQ